MRQLWFLVLVVFAGCSFFKDTDIVVNKTGMCGNGALDPGEFCDGNCPEACNDGNVCTTDILEGSAENCDARCTATEITTCTPDRCCATGCTAGNDEDCALCGNGNIDGTETCDGDCPTTCVDDGNICTNEVLVGAPESCNVVCTEIEITECIDGDGCCATGCGDSDSDCVACGNGMIDGQEACDRAISSGDGQCPEPNECGDNKACTSDTLIGSAAACSAVCKHTDITECIDGDGCCAPGCRDDEDDDCSYCGNGNLEAFETCDNTSNTLCERCEDSEACTVEIETGAAETCDLVCERTTIVACIDEDGCCPAGCHDVNDSDCDLCGNGIVESQFETCDSGPTSDTPCPTDCDDGSFCTRDTASGSRDLCTFACEHAEILECIDGDGCCAKNCTPNNDSDCSPVGGPCQYDEQCVASSTGDRVCIKANVIGYCSAECEPADGCPGANAACVDLGMVSVFNCYRDCSAGCLFNEQCIASLPPVCLPM